MQNVIHRAKVARAKQDSGQELVLKQKHPLAIRWFHWINFPVLATMVWSGLLIFWADSDGKITLFGRPVFPDSFYQPHAPSWWPAWLPHMAQTENGHQVMYLYSLQFRLAEGMYWHFLFFWFFTINGLIYILFLAFSGQWKTIIPTKESLRESIRVVLHELHLSKKKPSQVGVYNHAQRIAYTGVIGLGALMLISGVAIYKPTQLYWLDAVLGGYPMARWIHFWTTMLLCSFFVVHVFQVIRAGWANFRSMITGFDLEPAQVEAPDLAVEEVQ